MKKVSIIIPLYNGAAEIGKTIQALAKQTYQDLEIIIVDDGSKDNPGDVIAAIGDKRVIFVRQENQGPARARNNGLSRATGEYIMFLDHDDLLAPKAIEEAVKFLEEHPDYGVAYFDFIYYMAGTPPIYYKHRLARSWSGKEVFENMLRYGPMCNPSQALMRRSAMKDAVYENALVGSDDWDYFLQIASHGNLFGFIPKVLVYRELSRNSFTGGVAGRVKAKNSTVRLYEKWMGILPEHKIEQFGLRHALEVVLLKRAFVMIMDTQYKRAEIKEELRKLLATAKDQKTRFRARCILFAISVLPLSLLRALAMSFDKARMKYNFITVPAPTQ